MKNNKLIAEFMGMTYHHNDNSVMIQMTSQGNEIVPIDSMGYHNSWDWLMPVVEKCIDIYHIELKNDDLSFKFYDCIGNKERTYNTVVRFINEYNKTI